MTNINIKNFFHYYKVLCSEYLTYPGTYCAAVLIFTVCLIGPSANLGDKSYSIPTLLFERGLYRQALNESGCCAQLIAIRFDSHTLFTILFPVIASFPSLRIFTGNVDILQKPVVIRTNKRPYCTGLFAATFFSGFIITFVGIMLYIFTAFSLFTPIDSFEFNDFYNFVKITNFVKKISNICTVSGIFSILTVLICIVVHDKFLSLTLPMLIQYVSMKIYIIYSSWLYSDMGRSTNRFFNFIGMMLPYELTNHYSDWEQRLKLPFAFFFLFAAITVAGEYFIFGKLMERSIEGRI